MLEMNLQLVKQLALSLNHQNEGDNKVPYLSVAYTEVNLDKAQVDSLMGAATYNSWFNINGKDIQPMPWTKKVDLTCKDAFKDVAVDMLVNVKHELEFEGCRLYFDNFKLLSGGTVMADMHIHIIKHKEGDMIQIRRAEFTEVKLTVCEGMLIEKKSRKQRELPLEADPNADQDGEGDGTTTPLNGAHIAAGAAERDTTHVHWQQGENGETGNGPRCDMPADCVEIDPPQGSKSEAAQEAAQPGDTAEGNEEFAQGLAKQLGAHKKRGSAIDGRVRNRDRQRGAN